MLSFKLESDCKLTSEDGKEGSAGRVPDKSSGSFPANFSVLVAGKT